MRVLILAEQAGPDARPALARRAYDTAAGLATRGHDVRLVCGAEGTDAARVEGADAARVEGAGTARVEPAGAPAVAGLRVERVAEYPPMIPGWDAISLALHRGMGWFEHGIASLMEDPADVVHAHGWTVAWAAVGLSRAFDAPLVWTVDVPRSSVARARRWGRGDDVIDQTERWIAGEAARVVVRSASAAATLRQRFGVDAVVVPKPRARDAATLRARLAARVETVYAEAVGGPTGVPAVRAR